MERFFKEKKKHCTFVDLNRVGQVLEGTYGGRKVACKVMSMLKDEKEQEQLRREIQLQFSAKHPNIVEMIGLSKDAEKNLVIVMELVEGGDLLTLLKNASVTLEWPLRARMAKEIAGAIAFLHARNVVHRDLSETGKRKTVFFFFFPCNLETICKSRKTFWWTVKITSNCATLDLRALWKQEEELRRFWEGWLGFLHFFSCFLKSLCSSPYYSAPEIILGKQLRSQRRKTLSFFFKKKKKSDTTLQKRMCLRTGCCCWNW